MGSNTPLGGIGLDQLSGKSNYFSGNDPKKWIVDVPHYARIRYRNVYSGIDVVYYGNQLQLESDFVVAPRANPQTIRLVVEGAEKLEINSEGDLVLRAAGAEIRLRKPFIYQDNGRGRQEIAGGFRLLGSDQFGFEVSSYNHAAPLVIDPVLSYSTFLGGIGADGASAVAVDASGNAYLAGAAACCLPTTPGAFEAGSQSGGGFITKFDPSGTTLIYSTYLHTSYVRAIAVDSAGNVYATGDASNGFPVTPGAFQSSGVGSVAFIAKLNPAGDALTYATLLGPTKQVSSFAETTYGSAIAIDGAGSAYVTGSTYAANFPTTPGAFDLTCGTDGLCNPTYAGLAQDGFVTKIDPSGATLIYSTFLGGSGDDLGAGIAVDATGNAYVAGSTDSLDFPVTPGAFQTAPSGGVDAFVTKLNASGSALVYSTYLSGNGDDWGYAIGIDSGNNAYIAGSTTSSNFPTTSGSFQPAFHPAPYSDTPDAFVTKLNAAGAALVYSTYLGGSGADQAFGLALDSARNAYVVGTTNSSDFPLQTPFQAYCLTCPNFTTIFVAELNVSGSSLVYSSYLGGGHSNGAADTGAAIAVDNLGNTYAAGATESYDFPVINAYQSAMAGPDFNTDAFLTKISPANADNAFLFPLLMTFSSQPLNSTSQPMNVDVRNIGSVPLKISSIAITGDFAETDNCGSGVPSAELCTAKVSFSPTAAGTRNGLLTVTDSAPGSPHTVSLTGIGVTAPLLTLSTSSFVFGNQAIGTTSKSQTVLLNNVGSATLDITSVNVPSPFQLASTTCGSSLAINQSCALGVTFAPIQATGYSEELVINDNDTIGAHAVTLTGTGIPGAPPGFALAVSPPSSTITAGAIANYAVTVTPAGGWNNNVALTCSGLPSASSCSISPSTVSLDGINASTATVSITTKSRSTTAGPFAMPKAPTGLLLWISGALMLVWLTMWRTVRCYPSRARIGLRGGLVALLVLLNIGCGGGRGSVSPPPVQGTPAGAYTITLTGTSSGLTPQNTTFNLIVQ